MPDIVKLAATAERLIEANGRTVVFIKTNRTAANGSAPWRGPSFAAPPATNLGGDEVEAIAVFVPASGGGFGRKSTDRPAPRERDAEQIALVASNSLGAGVDLADFQFLRDGSDLWNIDSVDELVPGSTSVVWEVVLSR